MSNGFRSIWLYDTFLFSFFTAALCFAIFPVNAQTEDIVPFSFKIESNHNGLPGETISLNFTKIGGSEMAHGFDFVIGFDQTKLSDPIIERGELYDIPGELEWELIASKTEPFPGCDQGGCPTGLIKIASIADIDNGPHHPKTDIETGKIKVIPDYTVLFTLDFQVADDLDPTEPFIPVFFFWTLCSDNQAAFTYDYDGPFDIRSAFSLSVLDTDGSPGWIDITNYNSSIPTTQGAPDDCVFSEFSTRLCDFFNGGVGWGCSDTNSDGRINILDVIFLLNFKYKDGPSPAIQEYGDINNDTSIDILDIIFLVNYIYKNGPKPDCPQP